MRRTVRAAVSGALAASLTIGTAWAAAETLDQLQDEGVVTDVSTPDYAGPDSLEGFLPAGIPAMFISNGTGNVPIRPWATTFLGNRAAYQVHYPQSFWPLIASADPADGCGSRLGLFAPTYANSVQRGVTNNLRALAAIAADPQFADKAIILIGHSQGADTSANAYEQAIAGGVLDNHVSAAVIMADPRGPWGVKAWLDGRPLLRYVGAPLLGVKADGARDPEAITDGHNMTQIIIVGDPIANMQWKFLRPVSSLFVVYAGWATVHGANNPWSTPSLFRRTAENTEGLDDPLVLVSANGNVTYRIYDAYHPVAILQADFERDLGMFETEEEFVKRVQELDPKYQKWFEIEKPTIDNAAIPVTTPPVQPVVPENVVPVAVDPDPVTGRVPDEAVVIADAPPPVVAAAVPAAAPAAEPARASVPVRSDPEPVSESVGTETPAYEESADPVISEPEPDPEPAATETPADEAVDQTSSAADDTADATPSDSADHETDADEDTGEATSE